MNAYKTLHLIRQHLSALKEIHLNALNSDYKNETLLIVNNSNNNGNIFANISHSSQDFTFLRDRDCVLFIFISLRNLPTLAPECLPQAWFTVRTEYLFEQINYA